MARAQAQPLEALAAAVAVVEVEAAVDELDLRRADRDRGVEHRDTIGAGRVATGAQLHRLHPPQDVAFRKLQPQQRSDRQVVVGREQQLGRGGADRARERHGGEPQRRLEGVAP